MEVNVVSPQAPLSRWLAECTRTAHRRAEASLLPDPAAFDFGAVRALVLAHHRVLHRYAAALDSATPIPGVPPTGRWLLDAAADLRGWGIGDPDGDPSAPDTGAGRFASSPRTAELVGARYVVEGARLGLRALAGSAHEATVAAGVVPSRLFTAEPDAGGRWHAVRGWLDAIDREGPGRAGIATAGTGGAGAAGRTEEGQPVDRGAVLAGALEVFAAYEPGSSSAASTLSS